MGKKTRWLTVATIFLLILIIGLSAIIFTSPKFRATEAYKYIANIFSSNKNKRIVTSVIKPEIKGLADYGICGDTIIIANEDGVFAVNKDGEWLWDRELSLSNPQVITKGNYVAIGDLNGQALLLYKDNEFIWQHNFPEGIVNFDLTDEGIVTVAHKVEGYRTAVSLMNPKGDSKGKGSIKFTRRFSENYVISAVSSKSVNQVFVNGILANGNIKSTLSFLRMENGEVFSSKVIDGEMYPYSFFLKDDIIMVNSDKIIKCNIKGTTFKDNDDFITIWDKKDANSQILAAGELNDKYIIFAEGKGNSGIFSINGNSTVYIIDGDGVEKATINVKGTIKGIYPGLDNTFAISTENNVYYCDVNGNVNYEHNTFSSVRRVLFTRNSSVVFTNKDIHIITQEVVKDE